MHRQQNDGYQHVLHTLKNLTERKIPQVIHRKQG